MKSRYKVTIQGIVQGVGFRPFVYQQALARRLTGYVTNTSHGVDLEVEGEGPVLDDFLRISPAGSLLPYPASLPCSSNPFRRRGIRNSPS